MVHNFTAGRFEYREIRGLKPWQVYHFSLRYETIIGPSSWSYIISAQTKAEGMYIFTFYGSLTHRACPRLHIQ